MTILFLFADVISLCFPLVLFLMALRRGFGGDVFVGWFIGGFLGLMTAVLFLTLVLQSPEAMFPAYRFVLSGADIGAAWCCICHYREVGRAKVSTRSGTGR